LACKVSTNSCAWAIATARILRAMHDEKRRIAFRGPVYERRTRHEDSDDPANPVRKTASSFLVDAVKSLGALASTTACTAHGALDITAAMDEYDGG
jgi:hypothetical protein